MNKSLQQLFSLKGKTAVVTGGAGYLGTAMCETLAELGANLVIASRDQAKCEKKCEEIVEPDRRRNQGSSLELDLLKKDSAPSSLRACTSTSTPSISWSTMRGPAKRTLGSPSPTKIGSTTST